MLDNNADTERGNPNSHKRFITNTKVTKSGEIANKSIKALDLERIQYEEKYDGFYCVSTSLFHDDPLKIVNACYYRYKIEESFRIMKNEFKSRPVYISRKTRIRAHFLTCFIALLVYRILEQQLGNVFTTAQIISTLRNMNLTHLKDGNYVPSFKTTEISEKLQEISNIELDFDILTPRRIQNIKTLIKK